MSLRARITRITEIVAGVTLGPITRITAPDGSTPGHVVTVDADGTTLKLAAPSGGGGIDLTGYETGDLLVVDATGAEPEIYRLPIPADWASREYVLGIALGRPVWRPTAGTGGVLDPFALTVDSTLITVDSTSITADQTEAA